MIKVHRKVKPRLSVSLSHSRMKDSVGGEGQTQLVKYRRIAMA